MVSVFFFFSFAYTTIPAAVMKLVVFFRSSKPPYNFWWSGVADGHCAIRSSWCLLHIWRTQGHVGEGTIFSFLYMCALSLLWPERSRAWKPSGRACQEGGMHPSPFWVSALFWWWQKVKHLTSCSPRRWQVPNSSLDSNLLYSKTMHITWFHSRIVVWKMYQF